MRVYRVELYENDPKYLFDVLHIQAISFSRAFEIVQEMLEAKITIRIKSITEVCFLDN